MKPIQLIPPQDLEVESAILGCLMQSPQSIHEAIGFIKPEMFYKESHQQVYTAISQLYNESTSIDLLTVTDKLRKNGTLESVGGAYAVSLISSSGQYTYNIEFYQKILAEKWMKRELIAFCTQTAQEAYSDTTDPFMLHEHLQSKLLNIDMNVTDTVQRVDEVMKEVYERIEKNYTGETTGIKTGFTKFDQFSGGLQPSDLVIIAAESSQGKTSLALNIMNNACMQVPVGIVSLEMSGLQLGARLLAIESGIEGRAIQFERLANETMVQVQRYIGDLEQRNIFIDAKCSSSFTHIKSSIRQMVIKHKCKVIFVDYLQMISGADKSQNRAQEVSALAFAFKNLAKSLDITIVLISTLRKVDNNSSHYPTKARLKESGDIEYAADIILFVYYDAEYNPNKQINVMGQMVDNENIAEIIIAKGHNIGTGVLWLNFDKARTKFTDYETNIPF